MSLTPDEIEQLKAQRENKIDLSLVRLNNDIYQNENGLGENDRVYLVAAAIIATLGIPGKVAPLEKSDLKSSTEKGNTDGDILIRKIKAFLDEKSLPKEKKELIERTLQNTLTTDNINKVENGESQLKRVFVMIVDDLGIYYKIGLTTDFTGKLFNEMYGWLGFTQDKLNDVVLTPSYVGDDHIAVVHTENLPKFASIFVTTAIHNSSHTGKFDYGRNFYAKDADELNIRLPTQNHQPDYALMETLISAIQKLVIKDVVLYANRKIAATQSIMTN